MTAFEIDHRGALRCQTDHDHSPTGLGAQLCDRTVLSHPSWHDRPHWLDEGGITPMLYELRMYECTPGRLPDLNKAFSTVVVGQFEKHGIKQAGFWTSVIGESNQTLYYMLAWESLTEREKKWTAFQADPDWIAARTKMMEHGQIIANVKNFILAPTPYSAVQ
jgi:hypothetical protein